MDPSMPLLAIMSCSALMSSRRMPIRCPTSVLVSSGWPVSGLSVHSLIVESREPVINTVPVCNPGDQTASAHCTCDDNVGTAGTRRGPLASPNFVFMGVLRCRDDRVSHPSQVENTEPSSRTLVAREWIFRRARQ